MKTITVTIAALVILFSVGLATANAQLVTVAISGDTAPGTNSTFTFLDTPVFNNAGQTAFFARTSGNIPGSGNDGIWSEGGGNGLALIARAGNIAPGATESFRSLDSPILNDAGQTAFLGILNNGTDRGIWSEGGGNGLALIAREGNTAPGATETFRDFDSPTFNNAGQTAFLGVLNGSRDVGIWSEGGGSGLALIAREGSMAPGTNINYTGLDNLVLNNAGQTAFIGSIGGGNANRGIWSEGGGSGLALIALGKNMAPGTTDNYISIGNPALNNAGQTAFGAALSNDDISRTGGGIWSDREGSGLALINLAGDAAPGTTINFMSLGSPLLNNAGQMAFRGRVATNSSLTSDGIWSEGGGDGLALIARGGNIAPGTTENLAHFRDLTLNNAGQTAFTGILDIGGLNRSGIWAEDPSGVLTLIARVGDIIDVDDGPGTDLRTINFLSFSSNTGNGDGRPRGFNDRGQLAFSARFTDGSSGIFISNLVAIPEPSTLLLGMFAFAGLLATQRRRRK